MTFEFASLPLSRFTRRLRTVFAALVVFALGTLPLKAVSMEPGSKKPVITDEQFLELFRRGNRISSRTVPVGAVLKALDWSRTQSRLGRLNEFTSLTISNCIVEGDLVLNNQTVPISLSIQDSTFSGRAEFNGTQFSGAINISGVTFGSLVTFDGAVFNSSVDFSLDTYTGFTSFDGATFHYESTFND